MRKLDLKKLGKRIVIGFVAFIIMMVGFTSFEDVEPGEAGFIFRPWSTGIDHDNIYNEGTFLVAPWNDMIVYDVKQHKVDLKMSVLDKKGLEVDIEVTVVYKPTKVSHLHTDVGQFYEDIVVVPFTRDIVREVVGQYTAQELYSTKRDQLKTKCEEKLSIKMIKKNLLLEDVLIRDVNLPITIKNAILAKEKQEEDNKTAQKREKFEEYQANALVKKAQGKKDAAILEAEGNSEAIKLIQKELSRSPQYNEYIKVQGYANHGKSWFGENNMFGIPSASVIKGLK